ncbi:hypothetical protein PINS_up003131 [Pythium insidiosum]|nr:hypothetical protein PINS_up003131 [Pythium insidiosum]
MAVAPAAMLSPASLAERRAMKKSAQPEHSYTGHIPQWIADPNEERANAPRKRYPPILGYKGHLRHEEDRIGTTFTQGLKVAQRARPASAGPLTTPGMWGDDDDDDESQETSENEGGEGDPIEEHRGRRHERPVSPRRRQERDNQRKHVSFRLPDKVNEERRAKPSKKHRDQRYPEYPEDNDGDQHDRPMSARSGYGAFDGASGYGAFQARPGDGKMSEKSGYGAFDGASGYGAFQARPGDGKMSEKSGYGAFDGASGYGAFQARPGDGKMSEKSGYGAFDGASGYGAFQARPGDGKMSEKSGYGAFDGASGYGAFQAQPSDDMGGDNCHGRTGLPWKGPTKHAPRKPRVIVNEDLNRKYELALKNVGGESQVMKLLSAFATTISQRHHRRTELLQALKRSFERHEKQSTSVCLQAFQCRSSISFVSLLDRGKLSKAHLKEALVTLSCVFTDDQLTALMAVFDPECRGTVPMEDVVLALAQRVQ